MSYTAFELDTINLNQSKKIWTVQNNFGPIEVQGIRGRQASQTQTKISGYQDSTYTIKPQSWFKLDLTQPKLLGSGWGWFQDFPKKTFQIVFQFPGWMDEVLTLLEDNSFIFKRQLKRAKQLKDSCGSNGISGADERSELLNSLFDGSRK